MSRGRGISCAFAAASALLGLGAGCKSDGEDPGAGFITRYCDLYKPCCVAAGRPGDGVACRALFASTAGYNATAGEACLSTLSTISSQPGFCTGDVAIPFTCAQAFGDIQGACILDGDCPRTDEGDSVCVSAQVNGMTVRKCQVQIRGQVGSAPCVGEIRGGVTLYVGSSDGQIPAQGFLCDAADGLRCDGSACIALTADGQTCEQSSHCVVADFCDVSTGLCAPRKPVGAACIEQALECQDGSYCDGASLTCAAQLDDGATCTEHGQCRTGNCPNGTCEPTPSGGGALAVCG